MEGTLVYHQDIRDTQELIQEEAIQDPTAAVMQAELEALILLTGLTAINTLKPLMPLIHLMEFMDLMGPMVTAATRPAATLLRVV